MNPFRTAKLSSYKRILAAPRLSMREWVRIKAGMDERELEDWKLSLRMARKNNERGD